MAYSTKQVAGKLGVSENTIRLWVKELNAPHERKGQKIRFTEAHLNVLKSIKEFRENESGYDTIKRMIHGGNMEPISPDMAPSGEHVRTIIVEAIQEQTGLSLELSKATYKAGRLEATCEQLEQTCARLREGLTERDEKIFQLNETNREIDERLNRAKAELEQKTEKNAQLSEDNQALRSELDKLKESLESEQKKTWWDKLRGR